MPTKPAATPPPAPPVPTNPAIAYPDPIPGILPFGSLNIFGGASGVGKTTACVPLAVALKTGASYFGRQTHAPTQLYYLAADRDWRTYHTKFAAAGFPDIIHYALPDDRTEVPKARLPRTQFDLFERCMQKLAPIPGGFVFIDPIAPTFVRGDQNHSWDASTAMHHFRWVAQAYQVTLLCMSNVVKERTDAGFTRARDRISGSGALGAYSDTQFYLLNGQAPDTRVYGWAPREEAEVEYVVRFNPLTKQYDYESGPWPVGEGLEHSGAHTQEADSPTPDPTVDRPTQILLLIPEDGITGPDLWSKVQETLGIAQKTFYRGLTNLHGRQAIDRDTHGVYHRRKPS